jgi:HAMP domain-containing protein
VSFVQSSSIVRRFRLLTVFLGIFLILEFVGILISSQTYLSGLKKLNRVNTFVNLAASSIVNLNSATDAIENNHSKTMYEAAETELNTALNTVIEMHPASPKVFGLFVDAQKSAKELDLKAKEVFLLSENPKKNALAISKDLLILKQYELDINESLRGAQIELSKIANQLFTELYSNRLNPVLVAFGLAILFFIIALRIGLNTSKRLGESLNYILHATDEVARGNLNFKVPVLDHDEIGRLSVAFSEMVKNLEASARNERIAGDRISRLQDITAEFSRALNPETVGNAVVLHGVAELGASGGYVATISANRETLELLSASGYSEEMFEKRRSASLSARMPSTISASTQISFFCENIQEVASLFEHPSDPSQMPQALASVPLLLEGKSIGSLTFTFNHGKIFSPEERDFVIALADLASQALQRAQLYDDAQKAIQVREEFLSIASHELKTPITSLKMQLQLAQMQTKPEQNLAPTPQKLARVFAVSINQVNRLTSLVDDLLDVSRFEAGKLSFDFAEFNLAS